MTDPNFFIETPRLHLIYPRPEADSHCDFFVQLYNTPEFIAHNDGKPTKITTREAARRYIQNRFVAEHARHGYGTYMILLKSNMPSQEPGSIETGLNSSQSADMENPALRRQQGEQQGVLVGTISLSNGPTPEMSYAAPDLGFAVLPKYYRRGIATEASRGVMKYAAEEKGVRVFLGLHSPTNVASAGIFRKLGFSAHGKRYLKFVGGEVGMVWAGRLRDGEGGFVGLSEEEVRGLGLPKEGKNE